MPPPLDPSATPFLVDFGISLTEFERRISIESDEIAAAFDEDGRLVLAPRRGTPTQVDFAHFEIDALQDSVVTHVHPLGGPFSGADARFATDNDVAEMRIVLRNGVLYRLLRPADGWPTREGMVSAAEHCVESTIKEGRRREERRIPAMSDKEYDQFEFRDQRDAFASIGVTIVKESWR